MKKIAIIIQRYGEEVSGGGEFYARALSQHLKTKYDVTILTTTSLKLDFSKYYEAGKTTDKGVTILRFNNSKPRDFSKIEILNNELNKSLNTYGKTALGLDLEWSDEWGPNCPDLIKYVEKNRDKYDAFIVFTYIYYTAIRTIPIIKDKAIFIPTAHDEFWIRPDIFKQIFNMPRFFGFLTNGEEEFVRKYFKNQNIPSEIIGCGVDLPIKINNLHFREKYKIKENYIAYVGRVDTSKNCDVLIRYFKKYKKQKNTNLKLIIIGEGNITSDDKDIIFTGFVSEQEKFDALSGAIATVAPSKYESLCIAVLESFYCKVPVIANGECAILKAHCQNGKTGFTYTSEKEFISMLDYLVENRKLREKMGLAAYEYVQNNYSWDIVVSKLDKMINIITDNQDVETKSDYSNELKIRNVFLDTVDNIDVIAGNKNTTIEPKFKERNIAVCFTSSDYFAPICGVAISSLIKNMNENNNYDILVLTNNMSIQNKIRLASLRQKNCSIRFVEFEEDIFSNEIANHDSYNIFTYFRLMIPSICKKYKKVLYLDSDMIINHDIAELYSIELDDNYAAAVLDYTILSWQIMGPKHPLFAYLESLDLTQPGSYMQGGVALYNIEKINNRFPVWKLIEKANERHYQNCDQELLNICFKNKIKFIPSNWNVVVMHPSYLNLYNYWLPYVYYQEYINGRKNPYIIHYSFQQIPCYDINVDMMEYFWNYARNTPFYEELILMLNLKKLSPLYVNNNVDTKISNNKKYPEIIDKFLPKGSKRREIVKKIVKTYFYK